MHWRYESSSLACVPAQTFFFFSSRCFCSLCCPFRSASTTPGSQFKVASVRLTVCGCMFCFSAWFLSGIFSRRPRGSFLSAQIGCREELTARIDTQVVPLPSLASLLVLSAPFCLSPSPSLCSSLHLPLRQLDQ